MKYYQKVIFNRDQKFDIQLSQALIAERRLAEIFENACLEKIELKTETFQWEKHGNIAIEYRRAGKPSGISVTEATCWVHELKRDGQTLVYLLFPIDRLKELCRDAIRKGQCHRGGGDDHSCDNVLLPLSEILK